ncbi:MAG TPA: hypothetical protein VGL04_05445 [Sporichthyaceae bacterium]
MSEDNVPMDPDTVMTDPPPGEVDAAKVVQPVIAGDEAAELDPTTRPDDPRAGYQR